jgi:hypothetical protein
MRRRGISGPKREAATGEGEYVDVREGQQQAQDNI